MTIPMSVVWTVRAVWLCTFLFWIFCLVNFLRVRCGYVKSLEKLKGAVESETLRR